MLPWSRRQFFVLITIGLMLQTTHANHQQQSEAIRWIFTEIICLEECSREFTASLSPYLKQQLGFGENRPAFDLLDQCDGSTELQISAAETDTIIKQIKASTTPETHLDFSKAQLPPEVTQTALAICHPKTGGLSLGGDPMFKVISLEKNRMLVRFENNTLLKFEKRTCGE